MLEALKAIRITEEKNDLDKQELLAKIKEYSDEQQNALEELKIKNQELLTELAAEKEAAEIAQLQTERQELLTEAQVVRDNLQQQYEMHNQEAIDQIIERVKVTYGS
ncbi:DNA repair exonuclease SbcCD ATPase subunit [Enterococcus sp. PF1-24]|uniref:hypothetical protein n=1 Tax=unclassified Enterococcus TaxID=2608891 RepID=UPI0024769EBE|nr:MULTISPECIES: hypothetical protein [unclassified Enterococcus]MDH6364762.1 DNA repair exonuclease SbcCD ATPase subunit [Enterococcus sp. PFB1-1]MDH6401893.1 DNA repair exonuclease SbcCD ATPase subunit [Enterococcus sp. PF1-24]